MKWTHPSEPPDVDGQYFCWHPRLGKCVMGYVENSWGSQPPQWWLKDDQCKHQAPDGSFE